MSIEQKKMLFCPFSKNVQTIVTQSVGNNIVTIQMEDVESGLASNEFELFNDLKDYYNHIKNDLDESSRQKIINIINHLVRYYQKYDQMLKITELKKITFSDDDTYAIQEGTEIDFEKGIVYDDNLCNDRIHMETSEQVFKENQQWQGKAQLISLYWEDTTEFMISEIQSKKWKQFQHYQTCFNETNQNLFQGIRQKKGSQFLILINRWGKIFDITNYSKQDLEEKINGLIAENLEPVYEKKTYSCSSNSLTEAEYKEIKKQMKKFSAKISETGYNGNVNLSFEMVKYLKPNRTKIFNYCTPLRLEYNIEAENRPQISSFLENEWKEKKASKFQKGPIQNFQKRFDNLINFIQQVEIKEKFLRIRFFDLKIKLEKHKIEGQINFKKPYLDLAYSDFQEQEVNWILENLFQFIPESQWKIYKSVQKTISVEYPGSVCAVCKKDILQLPQQYYSPFKKEHVCVECAEFEDSKKKGSERFKYLDTLIFINGPLTDLSVLTNIDDQKIGNNLQLQEGEEPNQYHEMICDGCNNKAQGVRYIATNAKIGEYYVLESLIIAKLVSQCLRIRNQKKRKNQLRSRKDTV